MIQRTNSPEYGHDREVPKGCSLGPRSLLPKGEGTYFHSGTEDYEVETHHSGRKPFTERASYVGMIDEVVKLYSDVYPYREKAISEERIKRGLSLPSTILELVRCKGVIVGCGVFPRLPIVGEEAVYSTRFILSEHEGKGLGTHLLTRAIDLHQEEAVAHGKQARYGALMTQNAVSVVTLWKIPAVEETFPISKPLEDQDEPILHLYPQGSTAQRIMLGIHSSFYVSSRRIDMHTGVSKGELSELGMNESYKPSRDHLVPWKVHQLMISSEGLDMNREAGDEAYVVFRLKQPEEVDKTA